MQRVWVGNLVGLIGRVTTKEITNLAGSRVC
jgi:hypothetical protein